MGIGINGLGRVGRLVVRQAWIAGVDPVVHINDPSLSPVHAAYLLKYDSAYGRFPGEVEAGPDAVVITNAQRCWRIPLTAHADLSAPGWAAAGTEILVEASGVAANAAGCRSLAPGQVPFAVITQHSEYADALVVFGANEQAMSTPPPVIATNTCDAVAISPVLRLASKVAPIESVSLMTLHPWLSYQNLMDGPARGVSQGLPNFADLSLGRASAGALIPKATTAARCVEAVLPELAGRVSGMSYRVPTASVCYCHLTIRFGQRVTPAEVLDALHRSPYVRVCGEPLVSVDLVGESSSAVVDQRFVAAVDDHTVSLSIGYDNEWGFVTRVTDLILLLRKALEGSRIR